MKPRHILVANIFFAPFSYGGATIVAEQVAAALIRSGNYHVTAVSLCARNDLAPYVVVKNHKNGIDNYLINVPKDRKYSEMYNNPEVTARLAELIHALAPDLVHAHCVQELGSGVITAVQAASVPVILSVHDFWWLCERQFMIRVDGEYCGQDPVQIEGCKGCVSNYWAAKSRFDHLQEVSAQAACITYPSRFAKELSEKSGFGIDQGVVWENGVKQPERTFFAKQAERRLRDRRVSFGYIGGPASIKGWPQIKSAFSKVERCDFRVLVVDGGLDTPWWKLSEFKKLSGDWEIYPRFSQDDMDDFYAQIDVLLFMSQWKETFGLAIREAQVRGIEVIQTDSGGTVEHGRKAQDQLIPIGAPTHRLGEQIEAQLNANTRKREAYATATFDDQAQAFSVLVDQVLNKRDRAA